MNDSETAAPHGRHRADDTAVGAGAPADAGVVDGTVPEGAGETFPDAAARDAAKREEFGEEDPALHGEDIRFVTKQVSPEERAAVIAVLTRARAEETQQVKRVARQDREPWSRSQRVPEGIGELLAEG